jgi:hypothetical protein
MEHKRKTNEMTRRKFLATLSAAAGSAALVGGHSQAAAPAVTP